MDPQPSTVTVNGAELSYIERGSGDAVVFVHGSLGDYRAWGFQMEPFAQRYRAIAISRRRHWPNAWPEDNRECSVEVHAADLAAFVDALALGTPHLVGNSYGALSVLVMAARYPGLARSIVLGEPPLLPWLEDSPDGAALFAAMRSNSWDPAGRAFQRGEPDAGVRLFINGVLGEGGYDRTPPPVQSRMQENAAVFGIELGTPPETYFSGISRTDVAHINTPTLLVTGEVSPRMFHRVVDELAHHLPHAERAEIAGASHVMYASNPDAYNQTVLDFLARH